MTMTQETRAKISVAKKGRAHAPDCRHCTAVRSLSPPHETGERNPTWKGDDIGYGHAHARARMAAPRPGVCALADPTCLGDLTVAFRHDTPTERVKLDERGFPYSANPADYLRLCRSHHARYDLGLVEEEDTG